MCRSARNVKLPWSLGCSSGMSMAGAARSAIPSKRSIGAIRNEHQTTEKRVSNSRFKAQAIAGVRRFGHGRKNYREGLPRRRIYRLAGDGSDARKWQAQEGGASGTQRFLLGHAA